MKNKIFEQRKLLKAYDHILPLAAYYQRIIAIHLQALEKCEKVIDLGCGSGNLTLEYLKQGKTVTAVDLALESLQRLQRKAEEYADHLTVVQSDHTNLKDICDEGFGGASSMITAHLVDDYEGHIRECYRVLVPGGKFVITARSESRRQGLLVQKVRESLVASGEYGKYERDLKFLKDNLLLTANDRSQSLLSVSAASACLNDVGFRKLQTIRNGTDGVMYTLVAEK